jgi:hypothetical protein
MASMLELLRTMPNGVRAVLAYAFVLLSVLALTLPLVVGQAIEAPVSLLGLVWMALLAYLIFTITLILQRKRVAWGLSIGAASLTLPGILLLFEWAGLLGAIAGALVCAGLIAALRSPRSRAWFVEP